MAERAVRSATLVGLLVALFFVQGQGQAPPTASIADGSMKGIWENGARAFRGIPYAGEMEVSLPIGRRSTCTAMTKHPSYSPLSHSLPSDQKLLLLRTFGGANPSPINPGPLPCWTRPRTVPTASSLPPSTRRYHLRVRTAYSLMSVALEAERGCSTSTNATLRHEEEESNSCPVDIIILSR